MECAALVRQRACRPLARTVALLAAIPLLLGACGTRAGSGPASPSGPAPDAAVATANQSNPAVGGRSAPNEPSSGASSAAGAPHPSSAGGSSAVAHLAPAGGISAAPAGTAAQAQPGAPTAGARSGHPGAGTGPGVNESAAATPDRPVSPSAPAPGGSSSVRLGSVGTLSGPVGKAAVPQVAGFQVWMKAMNTRGGVNGHPLTLLVADDGGDPARHRALLQKMVETDKVLAFVQVFDVLSHSQSAVDYITTKRIPVIGGEGGGNHYYESPMYFPQDAMADTLLFATISQAARVTLPEGQKAYGILVCTEAQICRDGARVYSQMASKVGVNLVYSGQASLAQPDFTAQCLSARNAGVQVLLPVLDPNSIVRLADSCQRQAYHPRIVLTAGILDEGLKDVANLDGVIGISNVFPWFESGTPATDEFKAAATRFAGQTPPSLGLATGWTTGKLFEKASAAMPEPPTTEAILRGLWSLKGDDLGGLTQPLTFTEGQTAPRDPACSFLVAIKDRRWFSPDGSKLTCSKLP